MAYSSPDPSLVIVTYLSPITQSNREYNLIRLYRNPFDTKAVDLTCRMISLSSPFLVVIWRLEAQHDSTPVRLFTLLSIVKDMFMVSIPRYLDYHCGQCL